jgi:hypothetical protein
LVALRLLGEPQFLRKFRVKFGEFARLVDDRPPQLLAREVRKGDFLSFAAVRLHVLGGEMIRFEEEYEEEHGHPPDTN